MPKTILVVDDDEATRFAVDRILRGAGYEVLPASDGRQAIALLSKGAVDLIITDLVMPEKDGVELLLELRKRRSITPVIAISAYGPKVAGNYLKIAKSFGAQATLEKPITSDQLLEAVAAALSKSPNPQAPVADDDRSAPAPS